MQRQGVVDRIENGRLKGWAYDPTRDPTRPETPALIDILHNGTLVETTTAEIFRDDLLSAGIGSGAHAFDYVIPHSVLDKDEDKLSVRFSGTEIELPVLGSLVDFRKRLSKAYLRGSGIEIGALHNPLWVPAAAKVTYVDRMSIPDLHAHYPELKKYKLMPVDVVDDGEKLLTFSEGTLDFIIFNHFLEHCENPLGTFRSHLSKLKVGGVIYCTVPDERFFLDAARPRTTFEHLVRDDKEGVEGSRKEHYQEWVTYWERNVDATKAPARVEELYKSHYSIHFHIWEMTTFTDFLLKMRSYLDNCFEIEVVQFNYTEVITVLRRIK